MPPVAYVWGLHTRRRWIGGGGEGESSLRPHALPLVWEGEVAPEGIDRAERVLRRLCGAPDFARLHWYRVGRDADVAATWPGENGSPFGFRRRVEAPPDFKWWTILGIALVEAATEHGCAGYQMEVIP